ncbi:MAG: hypothetical protein COX19_06235 [Desulfobacterales bacterium CG23_combo_of_CG06-09_8_20_14_all_51_8]|nr:MAG: hypothetical protein COX19_06235 [Desulfobacterales bacterium CG23_combo_of_CG06-09_8_20_14_all_51_8]
MHPHKGPPNPMTTESKISVPGCRIGRLLYKNSRSLYFLGYQPDFNQQVIVRFLKKKNISADDISRIENEFALLSELSGIDGVPHPLKIQTTRIGPALILKYFEGRLLADILGNRHSEKPSAGDSDHATETDDPIGEFLSLAIPLTRLVEKIHTAGIIFQQIQPENIVWNAKTGQVMLVDFSSARRYSPDAKNKKIKDILPGNLSYIAPEQTGRMNHDIDFRTDFYALGVSFYEMLTGSLPFRTTDAMQLIHAHMAKILESPDCLNPEIPTVISEIVLKLMAKNPANRYQSAHGLLADLQKCREQLKAKIIDFEIGQADIANKLTLPQKIFGRGPEIEKLLNAFERTAAGSLEALLVTGGFGIGKSRLVEEIQGPVRHKNGFFVASGYDRLKQDIPYAPIVQAFRDLIRQILTMEESRIGEWRDILTKELGDDACRLMAGVVPELASITGAATSVTELSILATEKRFLRIFKQFITLFASADHPLVIFMDNLQWADTASLVLMENMLQTPETGYCLLIGAYRESDAQNSRTLDFFTKAFNSLPIRWDIIPLQPLSPDPVNQMVADIFSLPPDKTLDLSDLIRKKTGGNPFFIFQFIKTLNEKGLIIFDGAWQFDLPAIAQSDITENLADFMALHLRKLPGDALEILQTAACIGVQFDPDLIIRVTQKSQAVVTGVLVEGITEGLLVSVGKEIRFAHDRVRDAAYTLMDKEMRILRHLAVGQALVTGKNQAQVAENIFEIVYHLNQAMDRIDDPRERISLAGHNLTAALKAKHSSAYSSARRYLYKAISLLTERCWEEDYDLTLAIHNEQCEIGYLTGDRETTGRYFNAIVTHARTPLDKIRAYETRIIMFTAANQLTTAIALGIEALKSLGMKFPEKASKIDIIRGLVHARWLLRNKTPEALVHLPEMTDPRQLALAKILMRMTEPCYVESPDALVVVILKLMALTVNHGNSMYSAFAYVAYGAILCSLFNKYEKGHEFGDLAIKIMDRFNGRDLKAKVHFLIGGGIHHWTRPLREDLTYFMETYNSGLTSGDHSFAAYGLTIYMYTFFFLGEPLDRVSEKFNQYYGPLKNIHQESSFQEFQLWYQLVEILRTDAAGPIKISGPICNEDEFVGHWRQVNDLNRLGIHNIGKMILYYLADDMDSCLACARIGKKYRDAVMGQIFLAEYYFYYCLALLAACPEESGRSRRSSVRKIRSFHKKITRWALHAPENFEHKRLLIEAGLAALDHSFDRAMILFNASIADAGRNGFLQDEAIANEMAGKIWHKLKNNEIAAVFISRAYQCFARWGAASKLRQLENRYLHLLPDVREPLPSDLRSPGADEAPSPSDAKSADRSDADMSSMDMASVIRAAQAISEEIVLERLVHQLVRLSIETAGAEKGVLLLKSDDRFMVEAAGRLEKDGIEVTRPLGSPSDSVPVSLIRFVGRTGEIVLLSDASKEKLFSKDPYIVRKSPKSVICIPVGHPHQLTAVMYLENNLAEGVFTPRHQEILKIIAAQAAISIDNAMLYAALKDTEQRLNHILKTANEGFLSITTDAVITDINPEMCRIFGRKRDTVIGMSYYDFLDARSAEMVKDQLALRHQGKKGAYDITFTRPEGTRVECLVKAAPLFDKSDRIIGSFAMVTDITERKRAEAELINLNRELEQRVGKRTEELEKSMETLKQAHDHLIQSEKMAVLGGLVAGVTHEINTPIGIGITAGSFLEEKLEALDKLYQSGSLSPREFEEILKDSREACATIQANLKRAVTLVGSFKEIAVDQASENLRRFNLRNYIDEVLMSLQPKFKRTRHVITTVCPEDIEITSYPGVFSQILTNLIVNSLTHAFDEKIAGKMEIRVRIENDHLTIIYQDNGRGMDSETAAKIFDPFFTTRRSSGGAGLGMYIVYNIVTQTLGGSIQCISRPGEGIQFFIEIPMERLNSK